MLALGHNARESVPPAQLAKPGCPLRQNRAAPSDIPCWFSGARLTLVLLTFALLRPVIEMTHGTVVALASGVLASSVTVRMLLSPIIGFDCPIREVYSHGI